MGDTYSLLSSLVCDPPCIFPALTSAAGPKIDITVFDALRRKYQCATVQLDFQFPIRFNLEYVAEDGSRQRPVIVHRCDIFARLTRLTLDACRGG